MAKSLEANGYSLPSSRDETAEGDEEEEVHEQFAKYNSSCAEVDASSPSSGSESSLDHVPLHRRSSVTSDTDDPRLFAQAASEGSETPDRIFLSGFQQLSRLRSLLNGARDKPGESAKAPVAELWRMATDANALSETNAELEREVADLRVQLNSAWEVLAPFNIIAGGSQSIATLVCLLVAELEASQMAVQELQRRLGERELQWNAAKNAAFGTLKKQRQRAKAELPVMKAEAEGQGSLETMPPDPSRSILHLRPEIAAHGLTEDERNEQVASVLEDERSEQVASVLEDERSEQVALMLEDESSEQVALMLEDERSEQVALMLEDERSEQVASVLEDERSEQVASVLEDERGEQVALVLEDERSEQVASVLEDAARAYNQTRSARLGLCRAWRRVAGEIHGSLEIQRSMICQLQRQLRREQEVEVAKRRRVAAALISERNNCVKALEQQLARYGTEKNGTFAGGD